MHETGCTWNCSYLAKTCNNVGEMNTKYAEDPTWSSKVNNYIEKIKNN